MEAEGEKVPKIKICGITSGQEAEYLNEAKADYAGFVFYPKSRRNVSMEQAARLAACLDGRILKVAVTVSPTAEFVQKAKSMGFDLLQVHGEFSREARAAAQIPVWRAVNISDGASLAAFFQEEKKQGAPDVCGYVADGAAYGAGKTFDWEKISRQIQKYTAGKQLILAGGLTAENVTDGIRYFHPDIVDVSTGVEEQGKKSREKIKCFIRKVRKNEQESTLREIRRTVCGGISDEYVGGAGFNL